VTTHAPRTGQGRPANGTVDRCARRPAASRGFAGYFLHMISVALKVLVGLLVVYALIVLLAWRFQERLAFPGPNAPVPDPETLGVTGAERVTVTTADGVRLAGWYLHPQPGPAGGARAPGLVWFYGNMETVADLAPILSALRPPGVGVLVLDYRGYGGSEGAATEDGLYRDADAARTFLTSRPEIDSTRLAVYGRSLGSAVALYLATTYPVRAVVLESPFTSAREMVDEHYAIIPPTLLHLRLNNLERARALQAPLLVIHGAEDGIAPLEMGRAVAEAGGAEELFVIDGAGHNDTYAAAGARYREVMHGFLERHLR